MSDDEARREEAHWSDYAILGQRSLGQAIGATEQVVTWGKWVANDIKDITESAATSHLDHQVCGAEGVTTAHFQSKGASAKAQYTVGWVPRNWSLTFG